MYSSVIKQTKLTKKQYIIIQLFAALSLMGYWLIGALAGFVFGNSSVIVNIMARGVLALLAIIVIIICKKDIKLEKGLFFYRFYVLLLILYSLRMFYDALDGPFLSALPSSVFFNDILMIVVGVFLIAGALIASRKYLNVDIIAEYVFWMGFVVIILSRNLMYSSLGENAYMTDRITVGHSLHSLSLVRIGAFEIIAAIHLLINTKHRNLLRYFYIIGIAIGMWIALASGARGGLVGLILALLLFWVFSSRKNVGILVIAIICVTIFLINIVPILNWLSNYFPVISERMLIFVLYQDESNREIYRANALNYIYQNPILGFSYRVNTDLTGYTTHNGILDVALALGIPVCFVYFYFFYIKIFLMSVKMMLNKRYTFPSVMVVFSIIASISGSSITSEGWHFSMCILLSAYYYQFSLENKLRFKHGK